MLAHQPADPFLRKLGSTVNSNSPDCLPKGPLQCNTLYPSRRARGANVESKI